MPDNSTPLVSVVIPVYNGTNYLREAVDSVLAQTYTHYEIIVVDDGSTDGTWEIIQSYGTRIRGIHKENGGVASALNCGIREMRGEWFAWLSHDDLWLPEKLECQISFLGKFKKFKACYTDYYFIDKNGKTIAEQKAPWYPREQAVRALFGDMYINGSTILVERSCFNHIGFFSEELKYVQDGEMWLRLIRQFDIGHLPKKLVRQRSHPGQESVRLKARHREEIKDMYERIFKDWGIGVIFPELAEYGNDEMLMARFHTWFGDTMALHRGFYDIADRHYRISRDMWRSWRNIVWIRLLFGPRISIFPKRLYHYIARRVFASRFPVIGLR